MSKPSYTFYYRHNRLVRTSPWARICLITESTLKLFASVFLLEVSLFILWRVSSALTSPFGIQALRTAFRHFIIPIIVGIALLSNARRGMEAPHACWGNCGALSTVPVDSVFHNRYSRNVSSPSHRGEHPDSDHFR